ncbi:hypothetical protein [Actinospica robiniae]|uniref:hypothetical protein n=1 Tax=Actinospica robiniae TaxID=304901 RepID=UPI001B7FA8E6|nr:hypothetical protein [Actinospica robiniae]
MGFVIAQKNANTVLSAARALVEHGFAHLKNWHILTAPLPAAEPGLTQEPRHRAWRHAGGAIAVLIYCVPIMLLPENVPGRVVGLLALLLFASALPHVSYRKRDFLLLLIPFWGFAYAWRFGWRLALLPYRDWRPREGEMATARSTANAPLWTRVGRGQSD